MVVLQFVQIIDGTWKISREEWLAITAGCHPFKELLYQLGCP
jgi:hypothetical protein